jgi:NADPH:quinone reductase-like Zn-dependent oxidoreductase
MKAIVQDRYGSPQDVLRLEDIEWGLRTLKNPVPGCDLAGQVEAVGSNVTRLQPGDEVFGSPSMRGFGALAERASVSDDVLAAKPANLSFGDAAAVPLAALTALQGLRDHGQVERGHKVLIIGASGGVGTFAVPIAKHTGAEVPGVQHEVRRHGPIARGGPRHRLPGGRARSREGRNRRLTGVRAA